MRNKENNSGRWGRRTLTTLITVLVVVGVILANLLLSVLGQAYVWQIDETVDRYITEDKKGMHHSLYSLTDAFEKLIGESAIPMVDQINNDRANKGEDPITVNIIFCADRDTVWNSDSMRYVLYTALQLEQSFPHQIDVSFINIQQNPSAVQKYKATSTTQIYSSNVIFEFGTEYRVYSHNTFFTYNESTATKPWAYNGEKHFANAILAVTRAESPVACFLTNHGERVSECQEFRTIVERAGYIVQDLDLEKDDIPENCRMLICYDPQTDFYAFGNLGETGISEIDKLDKYLDGCFSFMLFIDNKTPSLPNLEEYLTEWGITVARAQDSQGNTHNYTIRDTVQKLDKDGYTPIGVYAQEGLGASITSDMRQAAYPAKVVFPNATSIQMSESYKYTYVEADETNDVEAYRYGSYYRNGITRNFNDVFFGSNNAVAEINGQTYEITTERNQFNLMTLTSENRIVQETNYFSQTDRSYICVFASTEFASDEVLTSAAYGNADVLLASLRALGREVAPADLDIKAFKVYDIEEGAYTPGGVIATTVCLALIPAIICFGIGIVVNVKRKYK